MANLILVCRRCGHEAEDRAGEWAIDGLCTDCYVTDVLKPYRTELIRLWRKFSHYVSKGINVANLDHQIQAKVRRGYAKAKDAAPDADPKRIERLVIHFLITEAQGAAAGYSKILRAS